ncbi:MAG: metallopeptidase family protein [Proteobacteria bacterium]|nr:metallopeptidase family protein [Pseudomonadota bacterium]
MTAIQGAPPSLDDLKALAEDAFRTIPAELRQHVENIVFQIQDFPDRQMCIDLGLESPFDLLGLYSGVSIDQESVTGTPEDLNRIFLFRRPILDYWCETGEVLATIIRHVLIHEVGHHFGFSDEDMERIEEQE